jgi:hypothetical protein
MSIRESFRGWGFWEVCFERSNGGGESNLKLGQKRTRI